MIIIVVLLVLIVVGWIAHYQTTAARKPNLAYLDTPFTARVLARLPRLRRRFRPTPWLYNRHLQLGWVLLLSALSPRLQYDERQQLTMSDGGTTSLNWLGLSEAGDAPTLLILPTITGDPQNMRSVVRALRRTSGWRCVMCNRRGHGQLRLTAPLFNTLGHVADLGEQIAAISKRFPDSPLYAVGLSAGTAQLARYLGDEGRNSILRAAAAYAPGYDTSVAFKRFHPFYSRKVTERIKRQFLEPYKNLFGDTAGYECCLAASDLAEFQRNIYGLAGYHDTADYLQQTNPMPVLQQIKVPLLIVGADDDPLCVVDNMRENVDAVRQVPDMLLVQTRRGSHCAHFRGWWPRFWALEVITEYLVAAHEELKKQPAMRNDATRQKVAASDSQEDHADAPLSNTDRQTVSACPDSF